MLRSIVSLLVVSVPVLSEQRMVTSDSSDDGLVLGQLSSSNSKLKSNGKNSGHSDKNSTNQEHKNVVQLRTSI